METRTGAIVVKLVIVLGYFHFSVAEENACGDCNAKLDFLMKAHADLLTKYETLLDLFENYRDRIETLEGKIKDANIRHIYAEGRTVERQSLAVGMSGFGDADTFDNQTKQAVETSQEVDNETRQRTLDVNADVHSVNQSLVADDVRVVSSDAISRNVRNGQVPEHVAFSTYLDHDQAIFHHGQVVKCNGIIINDGDAYNPASGVFTAHIPGVYFFAFTIDSLKGRVNVELVKDGIYMVGGAGNLGGMGGNYAVVRLARGESV
ncbi:uncharacterized protein LOC127841488 [Dreissena polymorpha]|uniref:C1q domain-containing protein n=1 Tax=Dreissena polymorpha TaxID=45954 RepID=A0A9D4EY85_DREPO|nr:uncharacterized protein LOC127841488 [Dreissena polymorpha]KAH3787889.1 hypothetical protein DPMN_166020 [Dreissena polymorpha]